MKPIVAFLLLLGALNLSAQATETELVRSAFKLEKKAIVADALQLNEKEAALFWPIYEEYETLRYRFGTKRIQLVEKYLLHLDQVTDITADELVKASNELLSGELALRTKYYRIVKKKVSILTAARFYQIEDMINVEIRSQLFAQLPLPVRMP